MKRKLKLIATLLILPLFFVSCGDSSENANSESTDSNGLTESKEKNEKEVKVENRKISSSNFKISNMDKKLFKMTDDSEVELKISDGYLKISCEFEVVETYTGNATQVFVSAIALDANGETIEMSTVTNGEMRTDDSMGEQFLDFMMGEPGSKARFTFSGAKYKEGTWSVDEAATNAAVEKIESFKILTDR